MEVMGELKNAALEAKSTGELTALDSEKGRISYDSTIDRVKIGIGTEAATLPILSDVAALRDIMHAVGDIVPSIMETSEFTAKYSDNWLKLDGYGLYSVDAEPYLASDYPELAASTVGSSWVFSLDLGYGGAKDYLILPDTSDGTLIGVRRDVGIRGDVRDVSLFSEGLNATALIHPNDAADRASIGRIQQCAVPESVYAKASNLYFSYDVTTLAYASGGTDSEQLCAASAGKGPIYNMSFGHEAAVASQLVETATGVIPQGLRVNYYIKARETV